MRLKTISSEGIEGYCSDLIVDENEEIYLISIAGHQIAVKGLIANILEYKSVSIVNDKDYLYPARSSLNYSVLYQKLPSALYQGVIIPKIAFAENTYPKDKFVIISCRGLSAQSLFFKNLACRVEVPLHPDWKYWLWDDFIQKKWITRLFTWIGGFRGFMVQICEDELKDTVKTEIINRNPEIVSCFGMGGRNDKGLLFEGLS